MTALHAAGSPEFELTNRDLAGVKKTLLFWRQYKLTGKALKSGNHYVQALGFHGNDRFRYRVVTVIQK